MTETVKLQRKKTSTPREIENPFESKMTVVDVHRLVPPWTAKGSGEYLVCLHMAKPFAHPVKGPVYPEPINEMMTTFEHFGMLPGQQNTPHTTADAHVLLTPEQYDEWGRPYPGQKIKVKFEVQK